MSKSENITINPKSTKEDVDVELVKKTILVAQIKRKERIQAASDYVGFTVRMIFGIVSLVIGGLMTLGLEIPYIKLDKPQYYMAVGLSLLVGGKKIVSVLAKIANTVK